MVTDALASTVLTVRPCSGSGIGPAPSQTMQPETTSLDRVGFEKHVLGSRADGRHRFLRR